MCFPIERPEGEFPPCPPQSSYTGEMFIPRNLSVTTLLCWAPRAQRQEPSPTGFPSLLQHWVSQACPTKASHGLQVEKELAMDFLFLL